MNVQVVSDLHLEFHADGGQELVRGLDADGVDVLVVAGDLGIVGDLARGLRGLCQQYPEVVYVVGNHEYYHSRPARVHQVLQELQEAVDNLHWLQHSCAVIHGVRFAGTPLWFPELADSGPLEHLLNDFNLIRGFKPWVYEQNRRAVAFLEEEVGRADVVVTHHMPSPRCVQPQYAGSPLNQFFVCDVEALVWEGGATLWACGHTHSSLDLTIGQTRVVCNPFGYVPQSNPEFDWRLVVSVEPRDQAADVEVLRAGGTWTL